MCYLLFIVHPFFLKKISKSKRKNGANENRYYMGYGVPASCTRDALCHIEVAYRLKVKLTGIIRPPKSRQIEYKNYMNMNEGFRKLE